MDTLTAEDIADEIMLETAPVPLPIGNEEPGGWRRAYDALKAKGMTPLTPAQRAIETIPYHAIKSCPLLHQPRLFREDAIQSGIHIHELVGVLNTKGSFADKITVAMLGGDWYVIDGFHRLEAYRIFLTARNKQRPNRPVVNMPVEVFFSVTTAKGIVRSATFDDTLRLSMSRNAVTKLAVTMDDKKERAWRALLQGVPQSHVVEDTGLHPKLVQRMHASMETAKAQDWPGGLSHYSWEMADAKLKGKNPPKDPAWIEKVTLSMTKKLASTFGGEIKKYPVPFSQSLVNYHKQTAEDVAAEVPRRIEMNKRPDLDPLSPSQHKKPVPEKDPW